MKTPERLALFPLQTVLFPGGQLALRIFEPRYLDLVRDCLRQGTGFGVVAIKDGREAGPAAIPYPIGTYAEIIDWSQGSDGFLHIEIKGSKRFRIGSLSVMPNQLTVADVEWVTEPSTSTNPEKSELLQLLLKTLSEQNPVRDRIRPDSPSTEVAYRIAELLPLSLSQRYELLGLEDDLARIALIEEEIHRLMHSAK
ncbi:MAG: peptidase S16 [Gammaproteobacteria bacterium]|nr:peptidase S16 [Gammaproteobacteria bacterium]